MSDDTLLTIADARRALLGGQLSAQDLVEVCLDRIDATEDSLRAWVTIDREGALSQARACDPESGPLAGIPLGVKDLIDVAGLPTTASSKVLAGNIAAADAPVVAKLKSAGAIVLGKTNTQEFAYGTATPPTSNPWDATRIPGGSSGGSAVALSAGHCLMALGTDTAGSIRIPAALCGIAGLKPRPGLVSLQGVIPLSPSLDVVGPMAADVGGVRLMWEAIRGASPRETRPLVIGVPPDGVLPDLEADVETAYLAAIEILKRLGHRLKEARVPRFSDFDLPRSARLMPEALQTHREHGWWPGRGSLYTQETRSYLAYAESSLAQESVDEGRRELDRLSSAFRAAFEQFDVLVTPTVPCVAPTKAESQVVDTETPRRPVVMKLTRIPGPVNAARLAALSLPCGLSTDRLPIGLQLIGLDEWTLLDLGRSIEPELATGPLRPPL